MHENELNRLFLEGVVFGFDVGTASIGYAVRRGDKFLEAGVLAIPEETGTLKDRRGLRRQRRTLRSRKIRLRMLRERLETAGLPRPSDYDKRPKEKDPVLLRLAAVRCGEISAEDLHAAIFHLLRRRGYARVPWAAQDTETEEDSGEAKEANEKKEEGKIRKAVEDIRKEIKAESWQYPYEWLHARTEIRKNRRGKEDDRVVFPRALIEDEFRAICKAQKTHFPRLDEMADEILQGPPDFGHTKEGFRIFFKNSEAPQAGVFALHYPRFNNRSPGLDRFQPYDEEGRPIHRARRLGGDFVKGQFFLALQNFRLIDPRTRRLVSPSKDLRDALIDTWKDAYKKWLAEKEGEKKKRPRFEFDLDGLIKQRAPGMEIPEDQPSLTPSNLSKIGRSAYSRPSLREIVKDIAGGARFDPPPPMLRYGDESGEGAIRRHISEINHPLVRYRAERYLEILGKLALCHGKPDIVVVEAVRDRPMGKKGKALKRKQKYQRMQKENEKRRKRAEERCREFHLPCTSRNLKRLELWEEVNGTCPFCLKPVTQNDLFNNGAEIEHIVARGIFNTNDWNNLTISHTNCNTIKAKRTPFETKDDLPADWTRIVEHVTKSFRKRKLEIFISPAAEELLEDHAALSQTAYIARALRGLTCLALGWETKDGHDPSAEPEAVPRFQITNGALTSFFRDQWNLNDALYPLSKSAKASDGAREVNRKKNRADVRHHAIDAMVISSTLPWEARKRYDQAGDFSRHSNPAGLDFQSARRWVDEDRISVKFWSRAERKAQHYDLTLLGKREKDQKPVFVARQSLSAMFDNKGKPKKKLWKNIYPAELQEYLSTARAHRDFRKRLCFSAFQRWREEWRKKGQPPEVVLPAPEDVKIPIRHVRIKHTDKPEGVFPLSKDGPWVERKDFHEVWVYANKTGAREAIFVPHSPRDPLYQEAQGRKNREGLPRKIIQKGDIVRLKEKAGSFPAGEYRIKALGQAAFTIAPPFASNEEGALEAFDLPKDGHININTLLRALALD